MRITTHGISAKCLIICASIVSAIALIVKYLLAYNRHREPKQIETSKVTSKPVSPEQGGSSADASNIIKLSCSSVASLVPQTKEEPSPLTENNQIVLENIEEDPSVQKKAQEFNQILAKANFGNHAENLEKLQEFEQLLSDTADGEQIGAIKCMKEVVSLLSVADNARLFGPDKRPCQKLEFSGESALFSRVLLLKISTITTEQTQLENPGPVATIQDQTKEVLEQPKPEPTLQPAKSAIEIIDEELKKEVLDDQKLSSLTITLINAQSASEGLDLEKALAQIKCSEIRERLVKRFVDLVRNQEIIVTTRLLVLLSWNENKCAPNTFGNDTLYEIKLEILRVLVGWDDAKILVEELSNNIQRDLDQSFVAIDAVNIDAETIAQHVDFVTAELPNSFPDKQDYIAELAETDRRRLQRQQ